MSTKLLERAELKAVVTDETHMLEFYAAAFSSFPDKNGDIIHPGALDDWLAEFYKSGFPLAISFTHAAVRDSTDPFNIIGHAPADPEHVFKDDHGLRIRAMLDTGSNPTADQVYQLTKRGVVNGASIAYIVHDEKVQRDGSTLIRKMSILEAGPCLDPANSEAYVIAVKATLGGPPIPDEVARLKHVLSEMEVRMDETNPPEPETQTPPEPETKAGRPLSGKNASVIKQARDLLDGLLSLLEDESASASAETKAAPAELRDPELGRPSPNADVAEALAAALR